MNGAIKYSLLNIIIIFLLPFPRAYAGISVNQTVLNFEPGESLRKDVEVFNHGKEPVFLKIEAFEIRSPGNENQTRIRIENPRDAGLLITPKRAALASGARQLVRFVKLAKKNRIVEDKIFRVTVTPVSDLNSGESAAVKVVVAYEILVILKPEKPKAELVAKRLGEWMEFSNLGNSNVLLKRGQQCKADGKGSCIELPGKRLYAGNSWRVKVPFSSPVLYEYAIGIDNFEKQFQ